MNLLSRSRILTPRNDIIEQLHKARALAEQGEPEAAFDTAANAQTSFPDDPEVNHLTGVALKIAGYDKEAERYFRLAHDQDVDYMYPAMELADIFMSRGEAEAAEIWANEAIARNSTYVNAHLLLARTAKAQQRYQEAIDLLAHVLTKDKRKDIYLEIVEQLIWINRRDRCIEFLYDALVVHPGDPELSILCAELLTELERYEDVVQRWENRIPLERNDEFLESIVGLARLSMSFDMPSVVQKAEKVEKNKQWLDSKKAATIILNTVKKKRPLSMIRVGDGEARFLIFLESNASHVLKRTEREAIGNSILWNWFGTDAHSLTPEAYATVYQAFINSLANADILGRTDSKRLGKDKRHFGFLAYMEERLDEISTTSPSKYFADAFLNTGLHGEHFYAKLFKSVDFIGFIGPHPDLARKIADTFNIKHHRTYLIPGEMRLPNREGLKNGINHYPDAYNHILKHLEVTRPGDVYLVAGGLLGKIYCDRVKALGGIAIDIGSIADVWAGYNTRPGQYDVAEKWQIV